MSATNVARAGKRGNICVRNEQCVRNIVSSFATTFKKQFNLANSSIFEVVVGGELKKEHSKILKFTCISDIQMLFDLL